MAEVLHHDNHGHDGHHEHDDTDLTVFGFWTYLMSDLILFGSLFIAFAVLSSHIPPGTPSAKDLFGDSLGFVLTETFALLISSVTFGFAVLASYIHILPKNSESRTLPSTRQPRPLYLPLSTLSIPYQYRLRHICNTNR